MYSRKLRTHHAECFNDYGRHRSHVVFERSVLFVLNVTTHT